MVQVAWVLAWVAAILPVVAAMDRAPDQPPVISRANWCVHGTPTRTTGECMCKWSNKDACAGPGCQYEYGLSWHHFSCEDCACQPKPWDASANMLRGHLARGTPSARSL
jgi:hypothetical protein